MGGKRKAAIYRFRFMDFFIIVLCLSVAAFSFYLFYVSLFQTFQSGGEPVGVIAVRQNVVQRRLEQRILWDRVVPGSHVYHGDLIRVAELSSAEIHLGGTEIALGENTLIRIEARREGPPQIELTSGRLNFVSEEGSETIILNIQGSVIEAGAGTTFNAVAGEEGMVLAVTEGTAVIQEMGELREIAAGAMIAMDTQGVERLIPLAAASRPRPNARFLKEGSVPLNIGFAWNRINIAPEETVTLEIAEDRNFSRIVNTITAHETAEAALDAGIWHWRLSYKGGVLDTGQLTVTETSAPVLFSPITDSVFRYRTRTPELQFNWSEVEGASHYIFEASTEPDFLELRTEREIWGSYFAASLFDEGTWFWRVRPVYPPAFEGSSGISVSSAAYFRVERQDTLEAPVLRFPAQDGIVNISPDRDDIYFSWEGSGEAASYTIMVSASRNLVNPVINRTLPNNFLAYGRNEAALDPGRYYWSVMYNDREGNMSPLSEPRSFIAMEGEIIQRLLFPPDNYAVETADIQYLRFSWETNLPFVSRLQVSRDADFSTPEIDVPVSGSSFQGLSLAPASWFWRIFTQDPDSAYMEFASLPRRFNLTQTILSAPIPERPGAGSRLLTSAGRRIDFAWQGVDGAAHYRFRVYAAGGGAPLYEQERVENTSLSVPADSLADGAYTWTIEAFTPPGQDTPGGYPGLPASGQFTLRRPAPLSLSAPAQGAVIPGLTALRQQTAFTWNTAEEVGSSRFLISRNANPGQAPRTEIRNPGRTVMLEGLEEGIWYWTVEAATPEGHPISAASPRQLRVAAIPLLPEAGSRLPQNGRRFGLAELRAQRNIEFTWSTVAGANAYIFSLYQLSGTERRRIAWTDPENRTSWTLDDLSVLDNGTFVWQVEAVNIRNNVIEQRGRIAENSFVIDIPVPRVQPGVTGTLYGN